jgi:Predicted pPIWI-associating nuclease
MTRDIFDKPDRIAEMIRQQERLRDIVDPPALRALREQEERYRDLIAPPALRPIREQEKRLRDIVDPPMLRGMRETMEAIQSLSVVKLDMPLRISEAMARATQVYSVHLPDMSALASMTAFAREAQVFSCGTTVIEAALKHSHLIEKAEAVCLASAGISKLVPQISKPIFKGSGKVVAAGNSFLASSFEEGTADMLAELPSEVFRALDLDIALPGGAQEVSGKERNALAKRTCDDLEGYLSDLDPQLLTLLKGARTAANSQNPDKTRHLCISLRELLGHALRNVASDAEVNAWTQDPSHFHNGKPTRHARIQYLYSPISQPALRKFIDADIRAAIELFDLLNKGTHVANLGTDAAALAVLLNRAEGILLLLLRLSFSRNTGAYTC